jgi:enoyl-CoA hydratase/carnithine racemase
MGYEAILYEKRDDKIAIITLNRPQVLNAFNRQMHDELEHVWGEIKRDPDVWVVIVAAAGDRGFCTGADLKEVAEQGIGGGGGAPREWEDRPLRLTATQNHVWKPVITAVQGLCAGGGLHFPADTDILICAEEAVFLDPHTLNGQVSAIETIGLTRRMPFGEVMRMVLTGGKYRITGRRAYEIGLASEVVPREKLLDTAITIAQQIAECSPATTIASKKALWGGLEHGLHDSYVHGYRLLVNHHAHPDNMEGARAFAEKRKPNWTVR